MGRNRVAYGLASAVVEAVPEAVTVLGGSGAPMLCGWHAEHCPLRAVRQEIPANRHRRDAVGVVWTIKRCAATRWTPDRRSVRPPSTALSPDLLRTTRHDCHGGADHAHRVPAGATARRRRAVPSVCGTADARMTRSGHSLLCSRGRSVLGRPSRSRVSSADPWLTGPGGSSMMRLHTTEAMPSRSRGRTLTVCVLVFIELCVRPRASPKATRRATLHRVT
jgi:hypothetical protein